MHVSLTPRLEDIVKNKVASGLYNNASEVVREALRQMDQHDEFVHLSKLSQLRKAVEQGAIQAENQDFIEQSMDSIIREAKKRKYGED